MEPIENEPKGWEEHKQNNDSDFGIQTNKETKAPEEVDDLGNDLSGNAAGNVPEEEQVDSEDEIATDEVTNGDPRGFMGDFAEPQHDEE
jgi:hypothetical protein